MKVSVIIIAIKRNIRHTMRSLLLCKPVKPHEVTVVVGSSADPAVEDTKGFADKIKIRVIINKGVGLGAARKTGVDVSEGDIIAFIDADCVADEKWIESIVEVFSDNNIVAQAGKIINVKSLSEALKYYRPQTLESGDENQRFLELAPTRNFAFRKELINVIGNFDPWFEESGEDFDFCIRLRRTGHEIHYNPNAKVYHLSHRARAWRDGRARARLFIKHKSVVLSDALVCFFSGTSLLASICALIIGYPELAFLIIVPSLLHRIYRAIIDVKHGNRIIKSLLGSLTTYISHLAFIMSVPSLALKHAQRAYSTSVNL